GDVSGILDSGSGLLTLINVGSPVTNALVKVTTDVKGRITDTSPVTAADLGTIVDSRYLNKTGDTMTGTLTMAGSIIPAADIMYDLGSPSRMWRDIHVGPGSIYMNGKKILEDVSDTIVFSTDTDQNLRT
ncbi:hypothetical protein, partial [Pseudomonas aeruginosa]|uniref:hypothetical protein n=1 Tax=Pseudomonas aeruginosa TaxID=287 RepID=UPI002237F160